MYFKTFYVSKDVIMFWYALCKFGKFYELLYILDTCSRYCFFTAFCFVDIMQSICPY